MKKIILLLSSFFFVVIISSSCKKEYSCENCRENNKPPIATAGPDQVIILLTDSILLDGSASSDPDGTISEWLWTKISGPASFNIIRQSDSITKVKTLTVGAYQFELKITDNDGLSEKDTMQVIVNGSPQSNRPPVANAGANQTIILPTSSITIDGSGSTDPDNNIISYQWTKISGPSSFSIINTNFVQTQVNNLVQGIYQFELKVVDAGGLSSTAKLNVIVDTIISGIEASWEVIITLSIDSVFIDDYYRDFEGTFVAKISGPDGCIIEGAWVKNLVPGVYYFRRYSNGCSLPAEIIKVTVLDDSNERNTITYKNLVWEISEFWDFDTNSRSQHLFLPKPAWPESLDPALEVYLQMDFFNNGEWFRIPSAQAGYEFRLDCRSWNNMCLTFFMVRPVPENNSWDQKKANLKIKVL